MQQTVHLQARQLDTTSVLIDGFDKGTEAVNILLLNSNTDTQILYILLFCFLHCAVGFVTSATSFSQEIFNIFLGPSTLRLQYRVGRFYCLTEPPSICELRRDNLKSLYRTSEAIQSHGGVRILCFARMSSKKGSRQASVQCYKKDRQVVYFLPQ